MGTREFNAGDNPDKRRPDGPLGPNADFTFTYIHMYSIILYNKYVTTDR